MSRHHAFCFTINNPTSSDEFACKHIQKFATYMIVGKEVAPSTGTPHFQGYIRLKNAMTFTTFQKYLTRACILVANGNDHQNQKYSAKEGNLLFEYGTPSTQGKRNDLKAIAILIKNKQITLDELMFEYPDMYVKYSRAFEKMFNAIMTPRTNPPEVHWRWGLAGTGKTRYCIETHPDHYVKDGTMWWDGYKQQEAIIIDDFDNQIPFRTLLRMLDRYVYQGQVKGGYVHIDSPFIYITSEHPPEVYWSDNELQQVIRRLTSVTEIKKNTA